MARADSTIRVNIIGDAKGLSKELGKADKTLGGFGKGLIAAVGVGVATDALLDFGKTAINEADRAGDAISRLDIQLGKDLTQSIDDVASGFHDIGLSRQDVLELAANFTDLATNAGIAAPLIADTADDVAAVAAAAALLGDQSPAEVVDLIGKAAGGSDRALRDLGINLDEAAVTARALKDSGKDLPEQLTDTEIAGARLNIILEKMKPKLDAVRDGTGDVEQKQGELQARFETLTGRIGEHLEGPLNDLLGWMLAGIDGLERMDEFLGIVEQGWRDNLKPLADFTRGLQEAAAALQTLLGLGPHKATGSGMPGSSKNSKNGGTFSSNSTVNTIQEYQERNGEPII